MPNPVSTSFSNETFIDLIHRMQDDLCHAVESLDGKASFQQDDWQRPEGGGGKTRVIANGNVFEKGGINTSVVHGDVSDTMRKQLGINGHHWFACGISSVIHPYNPFVPTVHFNYRMFELYDDKNNITDRWFGGGTDLTPYYLDEADITHFHQTLHDACEQVIPGSYTGWKKQCDDYFVNYHRNNERRGVGGIFYDHLRETEILHAGNYLKLASACGYAFTEAYLPIVKKHMHDDFTESNKYWQEIRRGRYTEFNLVHDKGTLFGLKTNGRIESILMSLPPTVRFVYDYHPAEGSPEAALQQVCLHPRDWL